MWRFEEGKHLENDDLRTLPRNGLEGIERVRDLFSLPEELSNLSIRMGAPLGEKEEGGGGHQWRRGGGKYQRRIVVLV